VERKDIVRLGSVSVDGQQPILNPIEHSVTDPVEYPVPYAVPYAVPYGVPYAVQYIIKYTVIDAECQCYPKQNPIVYTQR
jgi:hypothetical protein